MTPDKWAGLIFGFVTLLGAFNAYLSVRYLRMQKLDGPRSLVSKYEDLSKDFNNFKEFVEDEFKKLHEKTSKVPNEIQRRISKIELQVAERLAELKALTASGEKDHERYERLFTDLRDRITRHGSDN